MKRMRVAFSPFYRDIEEKRDKEKEPSKQFVSMTITDDGEKEPKKETGTYENESTHRSEFASPINLTPPTSPKIERARPSSSVPVPQPEVVPSPMEVSEPRMPELILV